MTTPDVKRSSRCVTYRSARACSLARTATNELRRYLRSVITRELRGNYAGIRDLKKAD
jgi:hypothetical protein